MLKGNSQRVRKRLDESFSVILEHIDRKDADYSCTVSDLLFTNFGLQRLLAGGICGRRHADIQAGHRLVASQFEIPSPWQFEDPSQTGEFFKVRFGVEEPALVSFVKWDKQCECSAKCRYCLVCLHIYKCNCFSSQLETSVCSHVHALHLHTTSAEEVERLKVRHSHSIIIFSL